MLEQISQNAWAVTLAGAMARLAGLAVFAPAFSHAVLPARLRWLIVAVLAMGLVARQGPATMPADPASLAAVLACELCLGLLAALMARLVLVGVQVGAQQISQQLGISLGASYDAAGEGAGDPVGELMTLLAVVVFLGCGGHRVVLAGLMTPPIGLGAARTGDWLAGATMMLAQAFVLALRLAGPVLVVMLAVSLALGALQRAVPAMHVFTIGLAVRAVAGLAATSAALVGVVYLVQALCSLMERGLATAGAG